MDVTEDKRKLRAFATVASESALQKAAARRKNVRAAAVVVMVVVCNCNEEQQSNADELKLQVESCFQ